MNDDQGTAGGSGKRGASAELGDVNRIAGLSGQPRLFATERV
jgi:hypothetical protein